MTTGDCGHFIPHSQAAPAPPAYSGRCCTNRFQADLKDPKHDSVPDLDGPRATALEHPIEDVAAAGDQRAPTSEPIRSPGLSTWVGRRDVARLVWRSSSRWRRARSKGQEGGWTRDRLLDIVGPPAGVGRLIGIRALVGWIYATTPREAVPRTRDIAQALAAPLLSPTFRCASA